MENLKYVINDNLERKKIIETIRKKDKWDVIVIGGGATGLGVALDSATRGFSTLLLEAKDFAKGTSSRSTKLVHGGVRYLAQGDVTLVKEALRERGRLAKNAPHLFKNQAFIIPGERFWTAPYYTFGLWLYDRLAGKLSIGKTRYLSKIDTQQRLPNIKHDKVKAGVCYYDGQFDDARLAITLYRTIIDKGGVAINYCPVSGLIKDDNEQITGIECQDDFSGQSYKLSAKVVVNATGVFANDVLAMDRPTSKPKIVPSQGIHLVLDKKFMPSNDALMVPKTSDGRVLFVVPWHNKLVVGTTDTLVEQESYEPKPLEQEIQFILDTAQEYLAMAPTRADIKSVFVGLRPLAAPEEEGKSTKEVSRSHKIELSDSGLVNIFGGKWTTYRQMAEDAIDAAIDSKLIDNKECQTSELKLHGHIANKNLSTTVNALVEKNSIADGDFSDNPLSLYGSDELLIRNLMVENNELKTKLHSDYPYTYAQVEWAVKHELAQTLEDVLARRIRLLFLDAKVAGEIAPAVAEFMATRLNWDALRVEQELESFATLVEQYSI